MDVNDIPRQYQREALSLVEDIYFYATKSKNTEELIIMTNFLQFEILKSVAYISKDKEKSK